MHFESKLLTAEQLDYKQYTSLQKIAYKEVLENNKSQDTFMTPQYYQWKYHGPWKQARIAVVLQEDRYIACNAMIHMRIQQGPHIRDAWQSCDTATHPDARGKGHFLRCLHLLQNEGLEQSDSFFGFPNQNSIRGFQKIGWTANSTMYMFVKPCLFGFKQKKVSIEQDFEALSSFLQTQNRPQTHILLTAKYLQWRYKQKPDATYSCFVYKSQDQILGFAIVRSAQVMGWNTVMVMDIQGRKEIKKKLLSHVAAWGRAQRKALVLRMQNTFALLNETLHGNVMIPRFLMPKKQILMGEIHGHEHTDAFANEPWEVQLGDWDVF
ncbi:MAG: hypothetical protein AAGJ35_11245 [Myxococcota bacterium]